MNINLEKTALVAEIVGGFAVIVSVIYLAFELSQNTIAMKSLTHQQMFNTTASVNQSISNDPQMAALLVKAAVDEPSLTESEKIQLTYLYINYFNMWNVGYTNYRAGFLEEPAWDVWNKGMISKIKDQSGSRFSWEAVEHWYPLVFREHVNAIIKAAGPITGATGNIRAGE